MLHKEQNQRPTVNDLVINNFITNNEQDPLTLYDNDTFSS